MEQNRDDSTWHASHRRGAVAAAFALWLSLLAASGSPVAPQSQGEKPKQFSVGFATAESPGTGETAGRILLWRPAPDDTSDLTVGDLSRLLCPKTPAVGECFPNLASAARTTPFDLARVASLRLRSAPFARAAPGRFPLVLLVGSIASRGAEFVHLAEALAAQGFVAAEVVPGQASPSRDFTREAAVGATTRLARALDDLGRDPGIDASRTTVIAWSFGGVAAYRLARHEPRVTGLISLDSALRYRYGVALLESDSAAPVRSGLRVLAITAGIENTVEKDEAWLAAQPGLLLERAVAAGWSHGDFNDQYGAWPSQVRSTDSAAFLDRYRRLVDLISRFLASAQ
jgi:dienelactone hydrolase